MSTKTYTKTLVTGGAGFIGRRVVEQLVKQNNSVVVLDNLSRGNIDLVPDSIRNQVKWYIGDTRDKRLVDNLVSTVDSIIHLASGSSFYMYETNPIEETEGTITGFLNIIESMSRNEVKKIVYASTSAVYEGNPLPYKEGMPLTPPDLKSFSKKVNEDLAHMYSVQYGIQAIGLRPFNVYGDEEISKGPFANTVSLFVWTMLAGKRPVIWGDGNQTRDFIFVDDVANAFLLALEKDLATQEFNIGTGVNTSVNKVVEIIQSVLKSNLLPIYEPVPIRVYARDLWGDMSHAEKILGFNARVPIEKGIERVINKAGDYVRRIPNLAEFQNFIIEDSAKRVHRKTVLS